VVTEDDHNILIEAIKCLLHSIEEHPNRTSLATVVDSFWYKMKQAELLECATLKRLQKEEQSRMEAQHHKIFNEVNERIVKDTEIIKLWNKRSIL
jgi:hypothetical protein